MSENKKMYIALAVAAVVAVAYLASFQKKQGISNSPVAPVIVLHPENKTRRMV